MRVLLSLKSAWLLSQSLKDLLSLVKKLFVPSSLNANRIAFVPGIASETQLYQSRSQRYS